ncbi:MULTISPECIES: thiol-disulfide oxidoreductase ResA [Lysinibacillus]|uniref:Thiol-disulfide oxidoreductase ResA n=1 Tax=Lysinibacillus antri TaxID=2498145 RepID=A0A432LE23_9BACI|nr:MULTISPECIES: thiol-disulfide oxidoreductase ResA [Lysinibacillus]RUL55077.1 thiol-disulfide oxidoreductase ResA [Lysinibacillus antri]TSI10079.1 thiol-disulfide oxidoreductase ResA [Lysinibacillus sp. BW-2-10]
MDKKKKRSITRGIILVVLLAAIVYTVYSSATKEEVEVLQVGDVAPDFELVDLYDSNLKHRLSDYEGKGIFLNFWGTWCEPCKKEMPAMSNQYAIYKEQGVEVLAVNIAQTEFEVKSFIEGLGVHFPVAIDETKDVMTTYNVTLLPATILINPEGKVEKIITGEMNETQIASYMESIKPEQE